MNKLLTIFLALLLVTSMASAQKLKAKKPAAKPKPAAAAFVRERFDPKRDAKADLEVAVAKAASEHKRVVLDVGGEWCSWCVYMDKFFFQHPALAKVRDDNFVWLKVNMSPENENTTFLSAYPSIEGYPHFFVLDTDGKLLISQDTSLFERGEVYSEAALAKFFEEWKPLAVPK